jgi:hypothetical protein
MSARDGAIVAIAVCMVYFLARLTPSVREWRRTRTGGVAILGRLGVATGVLGLLLAFVLDADTWALYLFVFLMLLGALAQGLGGPTAT